MQKILATFTGSTSSTHTISGSERGWFFSVANSGNADIVITINGKSLTIPAGHGFTGPEQNIQTIETTMTGTNPYSIVVFA